MENQTHPEKFEAVWKESKNPQIVCVATVADPEGKPNMITLEWFMRTSIHPPMLAVSIGHPRYSYECFQKSDHFNVTILAKDQTKVAAVCGTQSGRDIDKFEVTGVQHFPGRNQLPVIRGAVATFECDIVTQVRSGDHTIFVGEVKHSWLTEGKKPLLSHEIF